MTTERLRLKENHPLCKKLEAIFELMDRFNIHFEIDGNQCIVYDGDSTYSDIRVQDIEHGDCSGLPPTMEYKVTCDNPQYLEEREAEALIRAEQRKLQEAREKEELKEAEIKRLRDIEISERYLLGTLLKRYPDANT